MAYVKTQPKGYRDHPFLPIIIMFLTLCYVIVAMRIYTRAHLVKIVGWDDWFVIVALVSI
jgi:hypothetical protein